MLVKNVRRARPRAQFATWLRKQRRRFDPIGDLARDFIADLQLGIDVPSGPVAFRRYMEGRGACRGALDALADAQREWRGLPSRWPRLTLDDHARVAAELRTVFRAAGRIVGIASGKVRGDILKPLCTGFSLDVALRKLLIGFEDEAVKYHGRAAARTYDMSTADSES